MKMIKIKSLNGIMGSSLNREQLKTIVGGSNSSPCSGKQEGSPCTYNGKSGVCKYFPFSYDKLVCWVG